MLQPTVLMAVILILGLLCRNQLLTVAAACLTLLAAARCGHEAQGLQPLFINLGVLFLIVALLLPLISGKFGFRDVTRTILSIGGLVAIGIGIWATVLGREGVALLKIRPEIMLGITLGSIVGTAFCRGIPVGPLVAAGLVATLLRITRQI